MSYSPDFSVTVFDRTWLVGEISGTCVQVFCYGVYLNLFILALHTFRRRRTERNNVLLALTWAMAFLSTTQIVLRLLKTAVVIQFVAERMEPGINIPASPPQTYSSLITAHAVVLVLNNTVTDTLFLYRCYVIWGSRRMVVIMPAILMLATFVIGLVAVSPQVSQKATVILATVTNLCLMGLTAGRIWWIRREAMRITTNKVLIHRYNTVIAMLLESGALYFIPAMLTVIVYQWDIPFHVLEGLGTYLINIIPTLIIVRVGLGRSIHEQQTVKNPGRSMSATSPVAWPRGLGFRVFDAKPGREEKEETVGSMV
ncbi:hypothetical protein B0H16DRAFT_1889689 [Mycena metata]|uniref:Uncharacterized protein n=1 Tax=Mycena metata TaxID=1033252 RepID=A0AAD7IIQ5_9AGAR|nr:hypothetical protein B0H16DRAFT_1889689 [Mycena metata]